MAGALLTSIDALESQLALFREIGAVTREQMECLEAGDFGGVVARLRHRHSLLDRLARLVELPPAPCLSEDAAGIPEANEEIGRLLAEIRSFDKEAKRRIEESQRRVGDSLEEIHRGRKALAGYRQELRATAQVIDLTP